MAITNFATLQTAIITWAMRTDDSEFAASCPDFIQAAEHLINYGDGEAIPALRCRDMETTATITMTAGSGPLPTDYLQYRNVKSTSGNGYVLDPVSPDYGLDEYAGAASGIAAGFDIVGSTIRTYPPSNANLSMSYFAKVPALTASATTNWLLTKAPTVYLYAALIPAASFMMDDARMATWGIQYQKAVKGLHETDKMAKYARAKIQVRGATP